MENFDIISSYKNRYSLLQLVPSQTQRTFPAQLPPCFPEDFAAFISSFGFKFFYENFVNSWAVFLSAYTIYKIKKNQNLGVTNPIF